MIGKISKNTNFRSTVNYVTKKDNSIILGTNLAGNTPQDFIKEFEAIRKTRPTLSKPVLHISLSIHPEEKLTDQQWREIGQYYLKELGFTNCQYIIVKHTDTPHQHIHIVTNRISLDSKVISDSYLYKKQQKVIAKIEQKYNLKPVISNKLQLQPPSSPQPTHQPQNHDDKKTIKDHIAQTIDKTLRQNTTLSLTEFIKILKDEGIKVIPNIASTGRISGISFEYKNNKFKGSELGKSYTWKALTSKGLSYPQPESTSSPPTKQRANREIEL